MANPSANEEIRIGIANACLMMPAKSEDRRDALNELYSRQDREKELVADAREEAGVKEQLKRLHKVHGVAKATTQIMKILDKISAAGDRAAVITQVGLLSKDVGYVDKDLVSLAQEAEATAGQQSDDQGSVFDNTRTGEQQGGKDAQPKPVEAKADQPPAHVPTPGIPLDEALARFEEASAKWSGKGRKPKAMVEAQAVLDAARAATPETAADPVAELPEAKPGEITGALREGNAESEAHIREQAAKPASDELPPAAPARAQQKAAEPLQDELPPPAPRRNAVHRGLGPDAIH
ncbi:hypothetical protein [Methylobacterium sp. PvR107]|uniref:hypothetical protein n=1 Tax=Methylobacterium sp. PvR107 TaxID=2806597 RepID=UPI001AE1BCB4|nr:hypothetical protein [Methylobacterium sp. PvR107]MBP1180014.1 hypothetical protein [Methylobacterium sp. PvR107]